MTELIRLSPSASKHKKTPQAGAGRVGGYRREATAKSNTGRVSQPGVFGEGFFPSAVGDLVGDGAVELESHPRRLVPESLGDCLRVHSSRRHREAKTVTHSVGVLLGNVESSSLSGLREPLMKETTAQRFVAV